LKPGVGSGWEGGSESNSLRRGSSVHVSDPRV
jgi:hypothetical protein